MSQTMTESVALGVLGISVPAGTHLCVFFRGTSGLEEIVLPFLAEGIRANDKCLCILESRVPSDVLSGLARQVDVGTSVATGNWNWLRRPRPTCAPASSPPRTCSATGLTRRPPPAAAANFSLTRATGEMPSVLNQPAGRAEFFRYEARLNEVIPTYPQVILCLYDLERFGAEVLMDALRTHPMVVVDGMVHDNPYYVEPGKFLVGRN